MPLINQLGKFFTVIRETNFFPMLRNWFYTFALLGIIFIPVQFNLFPWQDAITNNLFGSLIEVSANLFNLKMINPAVSSDSVSMYLLVFLLIALSFILTFFSKKLFNSKNIFIVLQCIIYFYLSLHLLKYGFDKVFKYQFYLPEPNTLYTEVGNLSKDILYWTSMGTSYSYSVFVGSLEIIAALLILFRKSRILGLLLALGIMINVLAINFGFDISVKLFSMFLIFLILVLLSPQFKRLYAFFVQNKSTEPIIEISFSDLFKNASVGPTIKTFIISLCFVESLIPYVSAQSFNDDSAARPYLHGAYEVKDAFDLGDTSLVKSSLAIKRIFIHRQGYIIFENYKNEMTDYKLEIDTTSHLFHLCDYFGNRTTIPFSYNPTKKILEIDYTKKGEHHLLKCKVLNWKKLVVLKDDFHWVIDGY